MEVFRIVGEKFVATAFSGEGGLKVQSRWSSAGQRIVYTSQSTALASLEMLVHADKFFLTSVKWFVVKALIPPEVEISTVKVTGNEWRKYPSPLELRDAGDKWLEKGETAVMEVPSAVIVTEKNCLLNPEHEDFLKIKISAPSSFEFDRRLL